MQNKTSKSEIGATFNWVMASSTLFRQSALLVGPGPRRLPYARSGSERTLRQHHASIGVVGVGANKDMIVFVVERVAASSAILPMTPVSFHAGTKSLTVFHLVYTVRGNSFAGSAINTQLAFNAAYPVDDINKKSSSPLMNMMTANVIAITFKRRAR